MLARIIAFSIVATGLANAAQAHQDVVAHAHPHLMVTNEFIAAALMSAALALIVTARHLLARRKK